MQPLNIFFLHPSDLLTDHIPHGDGLLAFKFIRGLADRGHNIHVAAEKADIQSTIPANLHVHQVHPPGTSGTWSRLTHAWRSRALYNKLAQSTPFHLLHQTNPVTSGMSVAFAGLDVPLITGPYVPDWPPTSRSLRSGVTTSLSRLARLPFLELQHFQASQIILSTPAALQKFQWPSVYRHKTSVLPYGIDIDKFQPAPRQTARKTILFLAHVHRFKGVFDLFEAFEKVAAELPSVDLVIAGPGYDLEELKARAKISAFADRVRFLGKVSRDRVASVMADCDIYCLPSLGEPFGMTALEAMACGRALVATDAGGLGWLVPDGGGIKVAPGQPQELAQAFRYILADPKRSGQMGVFNRTQAETIYAWPKILDGLESIYQKALNPKMAARQVAAIHESNPEPRV